MKKKITVLLSASLLICAFFLAACSQQGGSAQSGPSYIDDKAVSTIAEGFEKRAEYLSTTKEDDDAVRLSEAVQIEADNDADLRNGQFENSKLQELVIAYLNSLDDQKAVLQNYQYGTAEFEKAWIKAYGNRTKIIKTLVDDYGLTVQDKYKSNLDKLIANGNAVSNKEAADEAINGIVKAAAWERVDEGHGYFHYEAIIENTTNYDFKNVDLNVSLFDADNVKTESHAGAQSWKKGEKVKFEAYANQVEAVRIEAEALYYQIG